LDHEEILSVDETVVKKMVSTDENEKLLAQIRLYPMQGREVKKPDVKSRCLYSAATIICGVGQRYSISDPEVE
jgi:hypothetical protein